VLSRIRDGDVLFRPEIATCLLQMADGLHQALSEIDKSGTEGGLEFSSLCDRLAAICPAASPVDDVPAPSPEGASVAPGDELQPTVPLIGELLVHAGGVHAEQLQGALRVQSEGDPRKLCEVMLAEGTVKAEAVVDALQAQRQAGVEAQNNNTIRVDVGLLDKLMNRVGELVLARNQILQFTSTQQDTKFLSTAQRLNLITTELQEGVMKTRMQPIGTVWNKLPRAVRDIALGCGKQVEIEMAGADTELDKTIIEAIKGPLTHIIRNSIDHGIEAPELRLACGKRAVGMLNLRASHEGGQVIIEIADDGGGIQTELVKQKAIAFGKIKAEEAERLTERELLDLVFLPGVSTAEKVTKLSGRGVGMDVVKTNIEKIGGTIELKSKPEHGTTIRIKIPLTLAIIPALIVISGGERFAIPQASLVELVRVEADSQERRLEMVHGTPVYRLRGSLLPLVFLNRLLKMPGRAAEESVSIVVLQAGDRQFGLVVDDINDTEEIVVKPLSKQFKALACFAGATIMGDGRVALILDVMGLAQMSRVVREKREGSQLTESHSEASSNSAEGQNSWLLFRAGLRGRMAIPLSAVARLEEFSSSVIEYSAGRNVIQYRGQIMPLYTVAEVIGAPPPELSDPLQVIVHSTDGASIGLIVDEILDIAEEHVAIENSSRPQAICGSAVIQQCVTDVFDMAALQQHARSEVRA